MALARLTTINLCVFCALNLTSQMQDTVKFKVVEIHAEKKNYSTVKYVEDVFMSNSLQNQFSEIYIKNYGIGQLSTLSVKGMGAENTNILWENLPLNSVMTGVADLNLLPNTQSIRVSYQEDERRVSSLGNIAISSRDSKKNYFNLSQRLYASSLFNTKVDMNQNFDKLSMNLVFDGYYGDNDFNTIIDGTESKLEHNSVNQFNTMLNLKYKLNEKWNLKSGIWYVNQSRDVPQGQFFNIPSYQNLSDKNFRTYVGIENKNLDAKISYFNENQQFVDGNPTFGFSSKHIVNTVKGLFHYKSNMIADKFTFNYHLYPSMYAVNSTSYTGNQTVYEAIQLLNLSYVFTDHFQMELDNKSFVNSNFSDHLMPKLTAKINVMDINIALSGEINKRMPTLNEFFWSTAGDPSLNPEINRQVNAKIHWSSKEKSAVRASISAEAYYLNSKDRLIWQPTAPFSSIWKPTNVGKVENKGLIVNTNFNTKIAKNWYLNSIFSNHLISSTTDDSIPSIYVPELKSIFSINLTNHAFDFLIQNIYTSSRNTSLYSDASLPAYYMMNIKLGYTFNLSSNNRLGLNIGVDNVLNEDYQEISGNYMPLRIFFLGIDLEIGN